MINFNGALTPSEQNILANNRAFLFGDAVFETLKIVDGKILFLEDHYFRLMASMRIMRMEIPMNFSMEYIESQILNLMSEMTPSPAYRVRMTIYREASGYYLPKGDGIGFLIQIFPLNEALYVISDKAYEVDLYKDFVVAKQLLSSIKSTNRALNITGSIYAEENGLQNCLLLNESKNVIEALNGNLFMLLDGKLITPPVSEGCINGIMRKQILQISKKMSGIQTVEEPISPFDLQKADELFITNIISGIIPVTKYRKKEFKDTLAKDLIVRINAAIRLG